MSWETLSLSTQYSSLIAVLICVEHGRQFFAFWNKANGEGVDAVARVLFCKAFALEDVAQVRMAMSAENFCAPSIGIHMPLDTPWELIIKTRPAAA